LTEEENIAWYVGYLETMDDVYFFCMNLEKSGEIEDKGAFRKLYIDLTEL